ncbi:MAG: hypothetical protein AB7W16_03885 [Candidatus Obscuribacterales bacterium]
MSGAGSQQTNFWVKQKRGTLGDTMASRTHTRIPGQPQTPPPGNRHLKPADASVSQNRLDQLKRSYEFVSLDTLVERLNHICNPSNQRLVPKFKNFVKSLRADGEITCAFNRLLSLGSVEIAAAEPDFVRLGAKSAELPLVTCSELVFDRFTKFDVTLQQRSLILVDVRGVQLKISALEFEFTATVQRLSLDLDDDKNCTLTVRAENPLLSLKPTLPQHLNFRVRLP